MDRLLSTKEVADLLSCCEKTVGRLRESGTIPHVRVGRLVRFRPDAVEAFLDGDNPSQVA